MKKKTTIYLLIIVTLILGGASYFVAKNILTSNRNGKENGPIIDYGEYVVIENGVKLWSDTNENSQTITELKVGDILQILNRTEYKVKLRGIEDNWYNVKIESSQGWIHGQYICKKDELNEKILSTYSKKLGELSDMDTQSVSKAMLILKPYLEVRKDQTVNDELFRKFYDFYTRALDNIRINEEDEYYLIKYGETGNKNPIDPADAAKYPRLKQKVDTIKLNGFRFIYPEGMPQVTSEYKYLLNNFSDYVSDGIREYLTIMKNEQLEVPIIEDAGLAVTWDDLAARIIIWENYAKKYPQFKEAQYAKSDINTYLELYCGRIPLDNSPVFDYENKVLDERVKQSYERFTVNYTTSQYQPLIKEYYNILKKNNWIFNDEADKFLDRNNIKKTGN